jgi:osmotically-inducible protein OsmY
VKIWLALALTGVLTACSAQQQKTASNTANDTFLVTAVGAKLASIDVDAVTRVHVAADHGVVTLSGDAHNAAERAQYVQAAQSVDGVTAVNDNLKINPAAQGLRGQTSDAALTARISAAIAGQAGMNAFHIAPSVHQGNVTLKGTVPTQSIHQTILQTVRGIPGVKSITDQIDVHGT